MAGKNEAGIGRLDGLREAAQLAQALAGRAVSLSKVDQGQRRMARRILKAINVELVAAGQEPVAL